MALDLAQGRRSGQHHYDPHEQVPGPDTSPDARCPSGIALQGLGPGTVNADEARRETEWDAVASVFDSEASETESKRVEESRSRSTWMVRLQSPRS